MLVFKFLSYLKMWNIEYKIEINDNIPITFNMSKLNLNMCKILPKTNVIFKSIITVIVTLINLFITNDVV